jgi:WD40 repeat protein
LRGHKGAVGRATFSHDGSLIVTSGASETPVSTYTRMGQGRSADADSTARVWEGRFGKALIKQKEKWLAANFSPDGKLLVTYNGAGGKRVWDAATGKSVARVPGREPVLQLDQTVSDFTLSPDGKFAMTRAGETVQIWDASNGKKLSTLTGHEALKSAAFSPDSLLVVTTDLYAARTWEVRTGKLVAQLEADDMMESTFSPDSRRVVTVARKIGSARVWDATSGKVFVQFELNTPSGIMAAFSPDGKSIVTTGRDPTPLVWDAETGRDQRELRGHTDAAFSAEFSPDGQFLVTASRDKTARLWETSTGKGITLLAHHAGEVNSAAFSPDGKFVVTASDDGTVKVVACEVCARVEELLELAHKRVIRILTPDERTKYLHEAPRK